MRILGRCVGVALGAVLVGPAVASGQNIFDDTLASCTGNNCSSLRIPGTVFSFAASAGQFVFSAFANVGECVRFDLISPPHPAPDMETVVISPDGTVFRNDDRNGALDRRPLVKIASAPKNGWYTVRVGQFAGDAVETNVVMLYGRYPGGNPNCATPTLPAAIGGFDSIAEAEDAEKDSTSPIPPPRPGHPGSDR
jgi:hypothetical protein